MSAPPIHHLPETVTNKLQQSCVGRHVQALDMAGVGTRRATLIHGTSAMMK